VCSVRTDTKFVLHIEDKLKTLVENTLKVSVLFTDLMVKDNSTVGYFQNRNFAEDAKSEFRRFLISKNEYFEICMLDFK